MGPPNKRVSDPRFSNIHTDPRYRLPSKKHTHVKLDKRFSRMLRDDEFSRQAPVDRYGREVKRDAGKEKLRRLYKEELTDEEDDEDEGESSADDDDEVARELNRLDNKYNLARDGGFDTSSSSSQSESEEEDEDLEDPGEEFLNVEEAQVPTGDVSSRLAAVNLDWDNIRAMDLMAVASSFAPPEGRILKVTVYPSEYGRERLEREELEGPPREIFTSTTHEDGPISEASADDGSESDNEEKIKKRLIQEDDGADFNSAALRNYQLTRLRYYYAVLSCSDMNTAKHLYDAMDGREYLSSANFFDLRFIPDSVKFDENPRDECESVPDGYRPNDFVTDALTRSKVKLTWDADDTQRKEVQKRAFSRGELEENDLLAYIGSDNSSSDFAGFSDEEIEREVEDSEANFSRMSNKSAKAAALRSALGLSVEPAKSSKQKDDGPVGNMQITFTSGLSSKPSNNSVFENEPITEETTMEKYIRKEKERKAKRKEKAKAKRLDEEPVEAASTAIEVPKVSDNAKSNVMESEDPFNDPFFLDPAAHTATEAKKARRDAKARKRTEREAEERVNASKRAKLELLMMDEDKDQGSMQHFDMIEIAKAEKERKRDKGGKKRKNAVEKAKRDDFQMDVNDPRFRGVFESHEFAIDPTNPRFLGTEGMKALLEEGRRKRKERESDPKPGRVAKGAVKRSINKEVGDADDLQKLVAKVKARSRK